MNILIDLRPLQNGKISGVEVFTENITRKLIELGNNHNFFLWTNAAKEIGENFPDFAGKNVTRIHTKKSNRFLNCCFSFFRYPKIDQFVKKECIKKELLSADDNFDIVFLPDLRPAPVSKNVKKYLVVHDLSFVHFRKTFSFKTKLWHKILKPKKETEEAYKIFTPSEYTKQDLMYTYDTPEEKIIVTSEGVDEKFYPQAEADIYEVKKRYNLPQKFLLSLSTLEPRKNLQLLLEAFAMFCDKYPEEDLSLVIAGQQYESIFARLSLAEQKKVIFTGFVKEEDKNALYSAALAFVFPSLFEGFGLPVIEAMASGTAVLCSDFSSLPEIAGDAALLFNPLNKKELCNKIEEIYFDPEKRNEIAQKGRLHSQNFRWHNVAKIALEEFNL